MTDAQLTIGGEPLSEQLEIQTTGRVIRPYRRMVDAAVDETGRVIRPYRRMVDAAVDEFRLRADSDGLHTYAIDPARVMFIDVTQPADSLDGLSVAGDASA